MALTILPPVVLGPAAAAAALQGGAQEVFCLLPDDYLEVTRRRVGRIYIIRAMQRAGLQASVRWAWYRESADGDQETVFLVTRKEE